MSERWRVAGGERKRGRRVKKTGGECLYES